jgi:teichuronic acid biosynthesis glycosyltransferase TuaC
MFKTLPKEHRITMLTPLVFRSDPKYQDLNGIRVLRYPFASVSRRPKFSTNFAGMVSYNLNAFLYALKETLKIRPKLVYANWVIPFGAIAAAISRFFGIPYILHIHGIDFHKYTSPPFGTIWKRTIKRALTVFSAGEYLKAKSELRFSCKVQNAGLVVDMELLEQYKKVADLRSQLKIKNEDIVCLFCSDVAQSKGADTLYEAAKLLTFRYPEFLFIFIGEGPLRKHISNNISSRIKVLGSLPPEIALKYFACADVFALPSHSEGLPPTLVEALAAGAVPITTDVGDCPNLITDGSTGFLIPPRNVNALLSRLILLHKKEVRTKMQNEVRQRKPYLAVLNAASNWKQRMLEILQTL